MALTDQQIAELRAALKRCRPETIEAALRFRETGDVTEVPTVVYGIIERHLSAEDAPRLAEANDDTRLAEDLGIDSLTLLEIVLSIEETLGISIDNEELRDIRTLGAVKSFLARKVSNVGGDEAGAAKSKLRHFDREAVATVLPHQAPFLFVDEASIDGDVIRASYTVRGDEYFLEGHFKGNPVFPASIVFEALGQAACLWILQSEHEGLGNAAANGGSGGDAGSEEVLFASMESAHFHRRAKPGDRLEMEAKLRRLRRPLAVFDGSIKVRGERLAEIEHLVLAFGPDVAEHLVEREKAGNASAELAALTGASAPEGKPTAATAAPATVTGAAAATEPEAAAVPSPS